MKTTKPINLRLLPSALVLGLLSSVMVSSVHAAISEVLIESTATETVAYNAAIDAYKASLTGLGAALSDATTKRITEAGSSLNGNLGAAQRADTAAKARLALTPTDVNAIAAAANAASTLVLATAKNTTDVTAYTNARAALTIANAASKALYDAAITARSAIPSGAPAAPPAWVDSAPGLIPRDNNNIIPGTVPQDAPGTALSDATIIIPIIPGSGTRSPGMTAGANYDASTVPTPFAASTQANSLKPTATLTVSTTAASGAVAVVGAASTFSVAGTTTLTGAATTNGITNTGDITTTTLTTTGSATIGGALAVTGAATTNGITNTGNIATTTLTTTGAATIGGALAVNGKVTGVATGTAPTDAANVGQLTSAVNASSATATTNLGNAVTTINANAAALEKMLSQGIAASSALSAIPEPAVGKAMSIGAGVAGYNGQSAVAVGVQFRNEAGTLRARLGVGYGGSKATYNAGVGYSF